MFRAFLALIGRPVERLASYLGELAVLVGEMATGLFTGHMPWSELKRHIVRIGYGSQIVIMVTGGFTGGVFAAQTYFKFKEFGIESSIGALVSVAMFRELGPVLTGLMIAGRVGAAMAAELGTMRVGEQIDALRVLGIHPVDYLVNPRFVAMVISAPLLTVESIFVGILASYYVGVHLFHIPAADFIKHLDEHAGPSDIIISQIKGAVFGFIIVVMSCHKGLTANRGAVGVGINTTQAVVNSSLAILVVNFFLTFLLNMIFPLGSEF